MTAVRTDTAKLIRYKDHPEWTELFDLAKDPYEMKNLFSDPAAADLRSALEAEYERQRVAVGYVWPEYADEPEKFMPQKPLDAWVLQFLFDQDAGDKVVDASGKGNHGTARGVSLAEGRDGRKARRFDGKGSIEVGKSPSLNPGVRSWTVEATFKSDKPEGVVLAHGGQSQGYCLALENGRPVFTVVGDGEPTRVAATNRVAGEWTTVTARWTPASVTLAINGQPAGRSVLQAAIQREPHDTMQIGADLGSPVMGRQRPPPFTGLIELVRLYSGIVP
jgi:hypothetical protein